MYDQQDDYINNVNVPTPSPPITATSTATATTTQTTQQSHATTNTPRNSLGSGAGLSYSSGGGSSMSPSTSSSSGIQSASKIAVSECLGAWLNYLQTLNNLCASGHRLAQTIAAFEQIPIVEPIPMTTTIPSSTPPSSTTTTTQSSTVHQQQQQQYHQQASVTPPPTIPPFQLNPNIQLITAWDDLAKSTAVATSTVKSHIVAVLQDFTMQCVNPLEPVDAERSRDIKQQIVMETTQTMINIQHQFCVASYDSFSMFMCCFVCQAPMGYPHDSDCSMLQQQSFPRSSQNPSMTGLDPRSQTPSPHFGSIAMNYLPARNEREMRPLPPQSTLFGSGSTQGSGYVEHNNNNNATQMGTTNTGILMESTSIGGRGASPHHEIRGPSPIPGFLDNVRGPLPNPGHLLGMKAPFYRGSRSPLNFPLFPLSGQRRWSEAAAGEVKNESFLDYESQMRRWSMPWEASKSSDKNTVSWHQTRIMPISKLAVPVMSKAAAITTTSNERSQSTTPDSIWQPTITSQDGLAEAIQLLSCRPNRILSQPQQQASLLGPPFIEEPQLASSTHVGGIYEMWSNRTQDRLPFIKFPRDLEKEKSIDENG